MTRRSPKDKNIVPSDQSTPIAKRTRLSSQLSKDFNCKRFRTPLNSHIYSSIFDLASPIVERVVKSNTLTTTFVPRIFESRDWAALFGNFEDPMDELVKECYFNISDLGVKLICWVRGKEFIINPNSIVEILHITRPQNMNLTPYVNLTPEIHDILEVLGLDHEVSSKGTFISTAKFVPKLTTLKLIMFSTLYLLSNTMFINLRRAQFLCDLITGMSIDICAHIFQTIRKTVARSATRGCIPFYSLIMKFILREGINPPSDGKMMTHPRPISMITLKASKSHSSRTPKNKPPTYETPHVHAPITPTQSTGTSSIPPGFQTTKQSHLITNVAHQISELEQLLHSFHNQTQMRLTTIETQLDAIQQKFEESF